MHRPAAFTLIELLIVLAVASLLALAAAQAWSAHETRARRASARAALVAAMAELERHHARTGSYAVPASTSGQAPGYRLSAQRCEGRPLMRCVEVVAEPARPDTACGALILRSNGERLIALAGVPEPAPPACWP